MKLRLFRLLLCLGILANMAMIFFFSSQTAERSNAISQTVTEQVVSATTPNYEEKTEEEKAALVTIKNNAIRMNAHSLEFFPLGYLTILLFFSVAAEKKRGFFRFCAASAGTVLFCFLYALADEWHQTFVPGRGFEWTDVRQDLLGSVAGLFLGAVCFLFYFIFLTWRKRKRRSAAT